MRAVWGDDDGGRGVGRVEGGSVRALMWREEKQGEGDGIMNT